jgi:glycerol-3-phosphate dehydrogenase
MFPGLEQQGLTGAAIFHEAQMYNPTRLSLSFLRAAVNAGAVVANYVQVTNLIRKQNRIIGVAARDRITGDEFDIRGRIVVNAAGPWAEQLLERNLGNNLHIAPSFSRDALFLIRRPLVHNEYALALSAKTKDKDALLSRGTRHLFLVPWRNYTLAGVWHVAYKGKPDEFTVTEQELQSFLDEINSAYPPLTLTLADITMWNAGLILFGDKNDVETSEHSFGKRSLIVDHSKEDRIEGLLTVIGVRYTTARSVAEKVVNHVFRKMEYKPPQSATATTPIYGGQIGCFGKYLSEATRQRPPSVCAEAMPSLVHNYGSAHQEVLKYINEDTSLGNTIGDSSVLQAEVTHAVREEMALKLADVVLRRTDLGTGGHPGDKALYTCAELMAKELSWDESRTKQELVEVQKIFPHF